MYTELRRLLQNSLYFLSSLLASIIHLLTPAIPSTTKISMKSDNLDNKISKKMIG